MRLPIRLARNPQTAASKDCTTASDLTKPATQHTAAITQGISPIEGNMTMDETQNGNQGTNLTDMPGEVLNMIYGHLMDNLTDKDQYSIVSATKKILSPSLAQVNHKLRGEYLSTIYNRAIIFFDMQMPQAEAISFVNRLPQEAMGHITKLTFGNLSCNYDQIPTEQFHPEAKCQARNAIKFRLDNKEQPVRWSGCQMRDRTFQERDAFARMEIGAREMQAAKERFNRGLLLEAVNMVYWSRYLEGEIPFDTPL